MREAVNQGLLCTTFTAHISQCHVRVFVKCGYSRDHEPQSRDHLSCSACGRVTTYHRPLWIHLEFIYNVIEPAF